MRPEGPLVALLVMDQGIDAVLLLLRLVFTLIARNRDLGPYSWPCLGVRLEDGSTSAVVNPARRRRRQTRGEAI